MLLVDVIFASIGVGLNSALETFVSQASGQKNYALCSEYLHRSRFLVTLYFLVSMAILQHADSIILSLGQDKKVAEFAQVYINYTAFGHFFVVLNDGTRRYLNSVSLSKLAFQVYTMGVFVQILLGQFFILRLKLGLVG